MLAVGTGTVSPGTPGKLDLQLWAVPDEALRLAQGPVDVAYVSDPELRTNSIMYLVVDDTSSLWMATSPSAFEGQPYGPGDAFAMLMFADRSADLAITSTVGMYELQSGWNVAVSHFDTTDGYPARVAVGAVDEFDWYFRP